MRIAIDAWAAAETPAGRGRYIRDLLRHLTRLPFDHEIRLHATRRWADAEVDADPRMRWVTGAAHPQAWAVAMAVRTRDADVVLSASSYLLAGLTRRPVVTMLWDLVAFDRRFGLSPGAGLERLTAPVAARRSVALVAISKTTAQDFARRFPRAAARPEIVTPGADAAFAPGADGGDPAALARHGLARPYVLAVGTLEPRKNLPRLIEAFGRLPASVRGETELVLVGARGWETADTFAAAREASTAVRTLGYVEDADLPALYRGALTIAYPSLSEGFGLPVLEALRCGIPVLTSGVSSLPEVAGDVAVYVDPENTGDIAAGLERLLSDDGLRARLAAAGPERARRFDWDDSARRMLRLLESAGGP